MAYAMAKNSVFLSCSGVLYLNQLVIFGTTHFSVHLLLYDSALTGHVGFCKQDLNLSDCTAIGYAVKKSNYQTVHLNFDKCKFGTKETVAFLQQVGDHTFLLKLK